MSPARSKADSFSAADSELTLKFPSGDPEQLEAECGPKPRVRLRLAVKRDDFSVCANLRYELSAGGESWEGNTPPDAVIDHLVQPEAKSARLTLWLDDKNTAEWELDLEPMDPTALETGAADRLANLDLGEYPGEDSDDLSKEDELEYAVTYLQSWFGKAATGKLDSGAVELIDKAYSPTPNDSDLRGAWTVPPQIEEQSKELIKPAHWPGAVSVPEEDG